MKVVMKLVKVTMAVALAATNMVGVIQGDFAKVEETMPVCHVVLDYTNLNPCADLDASQVEDMRPTHIPTDSKAKG